ncbi:Outer membrane porin F [bacterium HR21]|nr:Outer membrane porin F [bacterium HR21]
MWRSLVVPLLCGATVLTWAQIQARPTGSAIQITPVEELNSSGDDFVTGIARGGREVFLTSSRDGGRQRLYRVPREGTQWGFPERIRGTIADATHVGAASSTADGNVLLFAAFQHELGGSGRTDIYRAHRSGKRWRQVENLGEVINSPYWDSQPCISADGTVLIFASDRPGSAGGTDLWISHREGSRWSAPTPLRALNSAADEMAPVLAADGRTLYFASNRDGTFDIFVSRMGPDGSFGRPEKLPSPVNTPADEFYYLPLPDQNAALLSRTTPAGDLDVFLVVPNPNPPEPILMVQGTVRDAYTNDPLGATITITDLRTRRKLAELYSDEETGEYYVALPAGRTYSITASREGYLFYSERFEVPRNAGSSTVTKDIALTPVERGRTRLLVFFDFDKAELKEESLPDLDRLVEFLKAYPSVRISVEGHTDDVGTDAYNDRLSQRRADAVKEYLVKNGIDPHRIETKGWGRRRPLVQGTTEEARAQNRRVEVIVIQ